MTHANSLGGQPTFLEVEHARVAYWRSGRGPDLLFVHGWPLHSMTFRDIAPILSESYTCHFVDLPGAGASGFTKETPFGLREHASTLRQVVEALGLERFALLGHDSGGAIARFLAADLGSRVAGLVLSGTEIPGHHPTIINLLVALSRFPGGAHIFRSLLRSRTYRRSSLGLGGSVFKLALLDGEFHDQFIQPLQNLGALEGQLSFARRFDMKAVDALEAAHKRITAPALLLWGRYDPYFPADKAEAMATQFAGPVTFEAWDEARLLVHEDHPERFAARSRAFLEGCFGSVRAGEPALAAAR